MYRWVLVSCVAGLAISLTACEGGSSTPMLPDRASPVPVADMDVPSDMAPDGAVADMDHPDPESICEVEFLAREEVQLSTRQPLWADDVDSLQLTMLVVRPGDQFVDELELASVVMALSLRADGSLQAEFSGRVHGHELVSTGGAATLTSLQQDVSGWSGLPIVQPIQPNVMWAGDGAQLPCAFHVYLERDGFVLRSRCDDGQVTAEPLMVAVHHFACDGGHAFYQRVSDHDPDTMLDGPELALARTAGGGEWADLELDDRIGVAHERFFGAPVPARSGYAYTADFRDATGRLVRLTLSYEPVP